MQPDYGQGDEIYLSQRLTYEETRPDAEAAFDSVTSAAVGKALAGAWIRGLLLLPFAIIIGLLLAGVGLIITVPLALIGPWFMRDNVFGGRWYYSVENGWHLHESAFSLIAKRLEEKQIPAVVKPRLIASTLASSPRYYLSVRQKRHVAYISVMAYGGDLFVSWTMWREERPISLLWNYFKESVARLFGKGTAFHEIVRHDPARALRETVHNATRAGVDAATRGETGTIAGTFGQELAIEAESASPAPAPPVPVTAGAPENALPPPPVEAPAPVHEPVAPPPQPITTPTAGDPAPGFPPRPDAP